MKEASPPTNKLPFKEASANPTMRCPTVRPFVTATLPRTPTSEFMETSPDTRRRPFKEASPPTDNLELSDKSCVKTFNPVNTLFAAKFAPPLELRTLVISALT